MQILNVLNLKKKQKEGVEVKLLYDCMGCLRLPKNLFSTSCRCWW